MRLRDLRENQSPFICEQEDGSLEFVNSKGVSLPDSDLSEEAIYDLEAPTVSECVNYLDPTSDIHDQLRDVTPFTSLSDPDPDLKANDSRQESRPENGGDIDPDSAVGDEAPYISSGNADILEDEIKGSAIGLRSDDHLHDVVADQVNIASDPDCESTPDIVGIADHQWNSGTLEVLCLYATGETE